MEDKAIIYCPKHDHIQFQAVSKIVHSDRGCRKCGRDRVKKGIKPIQRFEWPKPNA